MSTRTKRGARGHGRVVRRWKRTSAATGDPARHRRGPALRAAGYGADVFHSNEGHAGFLGLERIRELVTEHGLAFTEALEAVRAGTIFTTHTPVPAGIDVYDRDLMERYFDSYAKECGATFEELMALGRVDTAVGGKRGSFQHGDHGLSPGGQS